MSVDNSSSVSKRSREIGTSVESCMEANPRAQEMLRTSGKTTEEACWIDLAVAGDRVPNALAISHHDKTLEVLEIRSRMPTEIILLYDIEQFEELCNNCLELRQLSITFPITSVSEAEPSSLFTTYQVKRY